MTAHITCLESNPITATCCTIHWSLSTGSRMALLRATYPSPSSLFFAKISRTFDAKTCFGGFSSSTSFRRATAHLANCSPSYKIYHKDFITMAFNQNLHCHIKYSDTHVSFYLTLMLQLCLNLQHRFQYKYCKGTSVNISSWNYHLSGVKNISVNPFSTTNKQTNSMGQIPS